MIPVPPKAVESVEEAETVPETAWRSPVKFAREKLEVERLVDDAVVEKKLVVVAAVPVPVPNVNVLSVVEPVARKFVVARLVVVALVAVAFPVIVRS